MHEESGITRVRPYFRKIFDVDVQAIPVRGNEPEHLHYDIRFLLVGDIREKIIHQEDESTEVKWVRFEDVSNYTNDPAMLRMMEKTVAFSDQL